MKTILTAFILLASINIFAENTQPSAGTATNSSVSTNTTDSYKPRKAPAKTDAYSGATRKAEKKKQSNP